MTHSHTCHVGHQSLFIIIVHHSSRSMTFFVCHLPASFFGMFGILEAPARAKHGRQGRHGDLSSFEDANAKGAALAEKKAQIETRHNPKKNDEKQP